MTPPEDSVPAGADSSCMADAATVEEEGREELPMMECVLLCETVLYRVKRFHKVASVVCVQVADVAT